MKRFSAKASDIPAKWWVIDAADQVRGRVAVKAAICYVQRKDGFSRCGYGRFCGRINAEKAAYRKKEQQRVT